MPLLGSLLTYFGYTPDQIKLGIALVSKDPIGYHLRGERTHANLNVVREEIISMAEQSGLQLGVFFELLMVYYTVDASSYEHLGSLFCFDEGKREITFSDRIADRVSAVREAVLGIRG